MHASSIFFCRNPSVGLDWQLRHNCCCSLLNWSCKHQTWKWPKNSTKIYISPFCKSLLLSSPSLWQNAFLYLDVRKSTSLGSTDVPTNIYYILTAAIDKKCRVIIYEYGRIIQTQFFLLLIEHHSYHFSLVLSYLRSNVNAKKKKWEWTYYLPVFIPSSFLLPTRSLVKTIINWNSDKNRFGQADRQTVRLSVRQIRTFTILARYILKNPFLAFFGRQTGDGERDREEVCFVRKTAKRQYGLVFSSFFFSSSLSFLSPLFVCL